MPCCLRRPRTAPEGPTGRAPFVTEWSSSMTPVQARLPASANVDSNLTGATRRYWTVRDAMACWVLLMVTGWPLARWHPWREVQWPAPAIPYPVFAAVVVCFVWVMSMSVISERIPRWLSNATAIAIALRFFAYEVRQRAAFGGAADNTEALEIGARALLEGSNPYRFSTHTGNPIGPLLGGLLFVIPLFVLMKTLAFQNFLYWIGAARLADSRVPGAGLAVVVLVASSPWSRATFPYLNDNGVPALGVVIFGALGYRLALADAGWAPRLLWIAAFSCALDYRWTMWMVALPYGAVFLRKFGLSKALTWLVPVLTTTLALFFLPFLFPSGGYPRTISKLLSHSETPQGATGTILAIVATLLVLGAGTALVRTLAGVWAVMAASLATLLIALALARLPGASFFEAFYQYFYYWYQGWVLVFGIAALVAADGKSKPLAIRPEGPRLGRSSKAEDWPLPPSPGPPSTR